MMQRKQFLFGRRDPVAEQIERDAQERRDVDSLLRDAVPDRLDRERLLSSAMDDG